MKKGRWVVAILLLVAVSGSGCYSRLEKPVINRRDHEPFQEKVYPAPTRYIQVNDVNLAYIEKGEGPTVILIHGGVIPMRATTSYALTPYWDLPAFFVFFMINMSSDPVSLAANFTLANFVIPPRAKSLVQLGAVATSESWQYNFDALAEHFHVIALDMPGFGNSEKPDIKYGVQDFTSYLSGFMQAKQIDKATLIGHDLGGLVAMDFCLTHPQKVESLVLISPYGTAKYRYGLGFINLAHYPRWIARPYQKEKAGQTSVWLPLLKIYGERTYKKILHRSSPEIIGATPETRLISLVHQDEGNAKEFMDQVVEYKFQYMRTKEFPDEVRATHLALVDVGRYDWWNIMKMNPDKRTDWVTRVKDINVPTLVIWGRYEPHLATPMQKAKEADYLDKTIPNSFVSIYANSAHYPMVEEAEKFNQEVINFLEGMNP
jgi:pimeloyl-ACP methyl ester carboxylesterase